jgi:PKD repeat protein
MRSFLASVVLGLLALPSFDALAAPKARLKNSLLTVAEPLPREPAKAHPFVNVIVHFGRLADFTPADPATFKAKMGREDVTGLFRPIYDAADNQIGMRARLEADRVKLGRRPRNVLRLSVQAMRFPGAKGGRVRDIDRVRFGAEEVANQTCTATAGADQEIIVPGIPVQFTGSANTSDPDSDELTYLWDFGDGTPPSTEADPQHTYEVQTAEVTATLTVSDSQDTCTQTVVLKAVPALDEGKTAGAIFVESEAPLAFGAVAPGATGTRTLTLSNTDLSETSQVRLRIASTSPAFQLSATGDITLGPGESRDLTVTFAPQAAGHQQARFSVVANASNRQAISFMAHGFGGSAPDNGPTLVADPLFFTEVAPGLLGLGTFGYMPDGRRFFADNGVNTCVVPGNGLGTGDFCVTDQNCAANGGTCSKSSTCPSGANAGQPCSTPADCPGSFCPSYTLFDPVDLCSDGESLFLVSDEGTFTDPDPNAETERAVTLMRMDLDANGGVTNRDILGRLTTETVHIACDAFPASQGGQVFVPEFHNVPDQGSCFRSEREALLRIAKGSGATQIITGRIDAYEGLLECDDLDPVQQLEMTRDGSRMLAAFESGGLWQIRPSPIFYSPDITDTFQVHPDGSALWALSLDSGSTGLVNVYRITPEQVQSGPLPYPALVPCASFAVPNNGGRTVVVGFGAARTAPGSQDAVGLVSFVSSASGLTNALSSSLIVRGTAAFRLPANSTECSVESLINLEILEMAF